jgi:hypothetical protein
MKALLFTLLLLLIEISPSLTAPSTSKTSVPVYKGRQRVIYTVFAITGVFNVECLYDPRRRAVVLGSFAHTELISREGFTEVLIHERRIDRWTFTTNPPRSQSVTIRAGIYFFPPNPGEGEFLTPGITIVDPHTVHLEHITFTSRNAQKGWERVLKNAYPQPAYFTFRTVLAPSAVGLDPQTEAAILELGMDRFLQQGARSSSGPQLRAPLNLSSGIWIHLLTNRMQNYEPGALECQPEPETQNTRPRPHPDESCSAAALPPPGPRDPDDPGDSGGPGGPGDQRGTKRKFPDSTPNFPELNGIPKGQCGSGPTMGVEKPIFIYDRAHLHIELQAGYTTDYLFIYPYRDTGDGVPTREDNTSSLKRPPLMMCFEISGY